MTLGCESIIAQWACIRKTQWEIICLQAKKNQTIAVPQRRGDQLRVRKMQNEGLPDQGAALGADVLRSALAVVAMGPHAGARHLAVIERPLQDVFRAPTAAELDAWRDGGAYLDITAQQHAFALWADLCNELLGLLPHQALCRLETARRERLARDFE